MKWAESQFEKWNDGWRPHPDEVDKYKSDRTSLALQVKRMKHDIPTN